MSTGGFIEVDLLTSELDRLKGVLSPYRQFLANEISLLQVQREFPRPSAKLDLRHAYAHSAGKALASSDEIPLTRESLLHEIEGYARASGESVSTIKATITRRASQFLSAYEKIRTRKVIPSSLDLTRRIDDLACLHQTFNRSNQPISEDELVALLQGENLRVAFVPNLALLSLCAVLHGEGEPELSMLVLREGVHPALKVFLLAHELAHWWLHFGSHIGGRGSRAQHWHRYYLRSAHDWAHLENEADTLALITMFPTPYLSWCENEGRLKPEALVSQFLAPYERSEPAPDGVRERLRDYMVKRIGSYEHYKQTRALRKDELIESPIREGDVGTLTRYLNDKHPWFLLNRSLGLVRYGQRCSDLGWGGERRFPRHFIDHLTPLPLQNRMERFMRSAATSPRSSFVFTELRDVAHFRNVATELNVYPVRGIDNEPRGFLVLLRPTGGYLTSGERSVQAAPALESPSATSPSAPLRDAPESNDDQLGESAEIEQQFTELAKRWRMETGMHSRTDLKCTALPYQRIIGMGKVVVPLILRELQKRPEHWFWALAAITGENPISESDEGYPERMALAWLRWGEERGYLRPIGQ